MNPITIYNCIYINYVFNLCFQDSFIKNPRIKIPLRNFLKSISTFLITNSLHDPELFYRLFYRRETWLELFRININDAT